MICSALLAEASSFEATLILPVVFDVDLHAGLLDDAANHLAAGPNHVADLIDWNLQGVDSRREGRNLLAGRRDDLIHLVEDEQAVRAAPAPGLHA